MGYKRLENPTRLAELAPQETLMKIGLSENHVVCDIGAGTGVFTIPAAKMTKNKVYALDINEDMLDFIAEKADSEELGNVECIKVADTRFALGDDTIDIALAVTVLHEVSDKRAFLGEIKRILKPDGKIVLIELHDRETPIGPPVSHRISKNEVISLLESIDFYLLSEFDLGSNFYCQAYQSIA
jgi:ubiquinone/menaquinone biosynthesis C-methylase UbiE